MVDKLKKVIEEFEAKYGKLSVFALLRMDEVVDKWSLIIASDSLDSKSTEEKNKIFDYVFDLLTKELSQEESASIGRIGFLNTASHIIIDLQNNYRVTADEEVKKIGDVKINGNIIHEGLILRAF